jgi:hypothetical protein
VNPGDSRFSGAPRALPAVSRRSAPKEHGALDPKPIESAGQSPVGTDPGNQTIEFRRKIFRDMLHRQAIVTNIVDGFDQPAHGVGQVRGCRCNRVSLSSHLKALSALGVTLAAGIAEVDESIRLGHGGWRRGQPMQTPSRA